jgi:2-polyprenyl-6-methoxyphenol hydroxylase-like FAD-dependent oxidoreductase
MTRRIDTQVLVVGGGPVGLSLAMDLAWRGITVVVAELRHHGEAPSVKCNHVSARTMEIFRRLGIAASVRNAGLPAHYPNDVAYRLTTTGTELARIPIPCRADRYTATDGPDTWWPTPEPPHRINQIYLEPILFAHAEAMAGCTILNRTRVTSFTQSDTSVVAQAEALDDDEAIEIRCEYLVGCEGGRSETRRTIGAKLQGDAEIGRVQSTYIRAPSLLGSLKAEPAWGTFSLNSTRSGNVYAIDGRSTWLVHNYLRADEHDFEAVDRDASLRAILGVGADFNYEIISKEDWIARRLVADRFRNGRAFICGDAAHLWVPMAGYGMNAGIADAMNLSWLLAAVLQGWAPESILDAHEAERLPITEQVSRYAMNHALALAKLRGAVPTEIDDAGPAGAAARERIGRELYDLNVHQYCCGGLNFGYFYDASPIIAYDEASPPAYSMYDFTPSTVPGCRTPHLWLRDRTSLYDALGPDYTLIRTDPSAPVDTLMSAAAQRRVPIKLLDLDALERPVLYPWKFVLSRPDQHVAWRGNVLPADPLALIDRVRGAGKTGPAPAMTGVMAKRPN